MTRITSGLRRHSLPESVATPFSAKVWSRGNNQQHRHKRKEKRSFRRNTTATMGVRWTDSTRQRYREDGKIVSKCDISGTRLDNTRKACQLRQVFIERSPNFRTARKETVNGSATSGARTVDVIRVRDSGASKEVSAAKTTPSQLNAPQRHKRSTENAVSTRCTESI